jgi:hypothetical protein
MRSSLNRKLLVSVYSPQEAREAVLGGGRIIDSEDPKSALGNISPLNIMAISDAVLDYSRDQDIQLSTNIGEDQLLFKRTASGRAVEKSPQEMAGKAAQAALGVALSMGTRVHPCCFVKVGLDGMFPEQLEGVLSEVVRTLRRTPELKQTPVMSVLFAQDLDLWDRRRGGQGQHVRVRLRYRLHGPLLRLQRSGPKPHDHGRGRRHRLLAGRTAPGRRQRCKAPR